MTLKGFLVDQSELGNVYYPAEGIKISGPIVVKYVEYPWITCFEVEGITFLHLGKIFYNRKECALAHGRYRQRGMADRGGNKKCQLV